MTKLETTPFQIDAPQPLMREIPQAAPYPLEALGPLQNVVKAVADITQAPPAIAAQSALSIVALVVQSFANVETLAGSSPCSLYCLTIAESGERKSTCDRLLMAGVREHEEKEAVKYRADMAAYKRDLQIWTEKYKRLLTVVAGASAEKAGRATVELQAMGPEPLPPLHPNLTAMDPTLEGLLKQMEISRPALGIYSDEGGAFLGGYAMNPDNGVKTMAGLSNLWDGKPVDRTRAGDGVQTYRGRRVSMHLMVQPVVARSLLGNPVANGQGFLARFLITQPVSRIGHRLKRGSAPESHEAVAAFKNRLTEVLSVALPTGNHRQELDPRQLRMAEDAVECLHLYNEEIERAQAEGGDLDTMRAAASKSPEQAARIAAVLTLWEDLQAQVVNVRMMEYGITLARYYLYEAKRLSDASAISVETSNAEELRRWLQERWETDMITARDLAQFGPNRLRETKLLKALLAILEAHGWVTKLAEGTEVGGVPRKQAWKIWRGAASG